MRLGADRGRVEEDFGAHQHHRARGFGIPLVPAHADAERRLVRTAPHFEAGVARAEIEFLLVAGAVGDVALAIDAGDLAVGADHRETVVMVRAVELEEAGRDPDFELGRELLHRHHRGMLGGRPRGREQALVLDAAEIGAFEQFGRKHDLGALARGFAHQVGHGADVGVGVFAEGELERGDGELGHGRASSPGIGRPPPGTATGRSKSGPAAGSRGKSTRRSTSGSTGPPSSPDWMMID